MNKPHPDLSEIMKGWPADLTLLGMDTAIPGKDESFVLLSRITKPKWSPRYLDITLRNFQLKSGR